ncbi:MAG: OsmC family protein [Alkalispirochaeta sp.]
MKDVTYSITAEAMAGTRLDVSVGDFSLIIDEPEKLGGTNAGPNPLEYELAALAGCLNVTGRVVARELEMQIDRLTMSLSGSLNPARFMGREGSDRAGFKEITASLQVDSPADAATLETWRAAVEERCPVSDNLANGTVLRVAIGQ